MIQPVRPGPVRKLAPRKPMKPVFVDSARRVKLTMCATMCTPVKKTIDQATALSGRLSVARQSQRARKVMLLSNGTTAASGVRRRSEMKLRQTGRRMQAASKWRASEAARAMAYVTPNVARALLRLSGRGSASPGSKV